MSIKTGQDVLTQYICCDVDPSNYSTEPQKADGTLVVASFIIQTVLNIRIALLKHEEKIAKILKFSKLSRWEEMNEIVVLEKQTIISGVAIFWTFMFVLAFIGLSNKIRSLSVEELNVYPNYLFLYFLQLISFQLFGFIMLITLFARQTNMRKTLFEAIKQRNLNF
jgi:hypothetical protein